MKNVSSIISKIIGNAAPTVSFNVILKKNWEEIVGNELNEVSDLQEAKYIGKNEISVVIKILNSAALLIKYNEETIIQNLKNLTGFAKVKLIFKHTNSLIKDAKSNIITNVIKASKQKQKIDLSFENRTLKDALESLKTEIFEDAA